MDEIHNNAKFEGFVELRDIELLDQDSQPYSTKEGRLLDCVWDQVYGFFNEQVVTLYAAIQTHWNRKCLSYMAH